MYSSVSGQSLAVPPSQTTTCSRNISVTQRDRERQKETERETEGDRERERRRQRERERDRERERETEREGETERDREAPYIGRVGYDLFDDLRLKQNRGRHVCNGRDRDDCSAQGLFRFV